MTESISRRTFVTGAAAALAGTALGQDKTVSPNEQLGVAVIGCGGQGGNHLHKLSKNPKTRILGVCDIYVPRRENAMKTYKAEGYHDYRKLLERKDVDAVWIATPDHWHSKMAIDGMEAGKDIYLEKPMAMTWEQARDIYRASLRTQRVVQVGSQDTVRDVWWKARDLIKQGRLGKLVWSQTSYCRNVRDGDWKYGVDLGAKPTPENLDWKAFLGPAPDRPYDPERFFRWRKYFDYSGGIATDLFVHVLHALCAALGNPWPTRVVSGGGVWVHKDRETPDTFFGVVDYEGEHSVAVCGSQANEQGWQVVIRGHEATMYLGGSGGDIMIRPERAHGGKEEKFMAKEVGDTILAHHENFMDCVKRRDLKPRCDPELSYKVTLAVDLMVRCWRNNKVYRFDPAREQIVG